MVVASKTSSVKLNFLLRHVHKFFLFASLVFPKLVFSADFIRKFHHYTFSYSVKDKNTLMPSQLRTQGSFSNNSCNRILLSDQGPHTCHLSLCLF